MGKLKTHEQFVEELRLVAPDILVVGEYVNSATKLKVRCTVDGHEWTTLPKNLRKGRGCPKCGTAKQTKTHEQFIAELRLVNPKIEVLGEYVNSYTKLKVRCLVDGYEWLIRAANLLGGNGCPKCYAAKRKKTHEQFVEELQVINPKIEVLGEYFGSKTKLKVRCLVDWYEWLAVPSDLLTGYGCPKCAKHGFDSSKPAEFYIYEFDDYYGFGITNNLKRRNNEHKVTFKKQGIQATLIKTFKGSGQVIQQLEAQVKQTFNIIDTGIEGFRTEAVLKADGCRLLDFVRATLDKS